MARVRSHRTNDRRQIVAARYRLKCLIGSGGAGEVWEAEDLIGGARVAVKLLSGGKDHEPARVRQEVAALRLLRIPGVVELIDDGIDGAQPFLVMELVDGTPFPGGPKPRSWHEIEEATMLFIETLARIHEAGVLHRDLKPENVLVRRDGRPVILDFGLALGDRVGTRLTRDGEVVGTPAYIAPEQITGEGVDARTDLYALGVVLYETLAGKLPHDARHWQALLVARLGQRPAPLREVAPEVPTRIGDVVDRLLERSIDQRPRSANEVLHLLRGHPVHASTIPSLPRIGGDDAVLRLLEVARRHRSVRVVGPRGSGRTRLLQDAAQRLREDGRSVSWTQPSPHPFGSVRHLSGPWEDLASLGVSEMLEIVSQRLASVLEGGGVIVADDIERVDGWSALALSKCQTRGSILYAECHDDKDGITPKLPTCDDVVRLRPFTAREIEALFVGPERIFHLRSAAARALHASTNGLASNIVAEVSAWIRAGVAQHDGAFIAVKHDGIEKVAGQSKFARRATFSTSTSAPDPESDINHWLAELLSWMALAWPHSKPTSLHLFTGEPLWRIEAGLEELVRLSAARRHPDGHVEPLVNPGTEQHWSAERRRKAHQRLTEALPRGAEGRLFHILAVADKDTPAGEISDEARTAGERLASQGALSRATKLLQEGLSAVRRLDSVDPVHEASILECWIDVALAQGDTHALDRVLYEICRVKRQNERTAALELLVRAALASFHDGERALEIAGAVPPFEDVNLERRRHGVRVLAARRCSMAREEAIVGEACAWAARSLDPRREGLGAAWLARLRYRQGRFSDAIALHARAAEGMAWETERIHQTLSMASCLLENFHYQEAAQRAKEALARCADRGLPYFEARAEWLLRSAWYRAGAPLEPDIELAETVPLVGVPTLEAFVCLNEAAVAWRVNQRSLAADMACRAHRICARARNEGGTLLAGALALLCGAEVGSAERLSARATRCAIPGIGIQVLGMLALAGGVPDTTQARATKLASLIPAPHWGKRMDILSVEEAAAALKIRAR